MWFGLERLGRSKQTVLMLICACVLALSLPVYGQNRNLTVVVLVNSQNASGYNPNPASPGEFQRFAERYLEHLQVPYEIFDVATASPPADLDSRQLILAGHSRLLLPAAWRNAIATAVSNGTGYVNLDSDPNIGTESHIATIFGATGSIAGTPATQIVVPAAVAPGGTAAHYIAAFQTKFDGSPGAQTYDFHPDAAGVVRSSTSTVLLNASGTIIAQLGNDPLILATTHGSGRAVHFGTMEYLRADRFGFVLGVDDLFWRSLVWAARKPFVLRGYPRLWAVQIDDTRAGFGTRVRDMYDPAFTGATTGDGRGGPWKVTGYLFTDNMPAGTAERAQVVADINAGKLEVVPHSFADAPFGNTYWNPVNGPLTDAEWVTNMGLIDAWKQGNGGTDTIPSFSRSLVGHFWHLSNNTGHDLWNRYGFRYVTSIIKPGFWARRYPDGAERIPARPFWNYEMPPKTFEAQYTSENYPFFFADDYLVGSRAGLPSQNFFLFTSQYLDIPRYVRLDYAWPTALSSPNDIPGSIAQLKQYTWRFWSGLSPVQLFTHDAGNYLNANLTERRTVITQSSAWMNANGVQHMFMDDLGDYIYARTKSTLTRATFDGTQLTYTFTGNAATADGAAISTQLLLFQNDSEGAWQTVPGFSNGAQVTRDLPPSIQSVTPPNGVVTGGTTVTVSGSGFTPASSVFFGANSAASVTFVDSSTLQAVTPAAVAVGSVDVRVVNVNGAAVLSAGFTYQLPPRVLVAAYSFNEGAGTVVADLSGNGNNGTITGATWNPAGRYGQALSFTGSGNLVTVNDANSLDLTLGMTLEAWVRPSIGTGWRTVLFKEQPGNIVYGLYANTNTGQPSTNIFITTEQDTRGTAALPLNAWTHLAATYDGSTLRLFINGVEASNKALPGILPVSAGALRIGGNSIWGEYFNGLIDEIRIYNRASTAAEIQSDMNAPLGDNVPPSVSISAPANGTTVSNTITVSATASDNLGVAGVQFFLDGLPLGSEDTVSPYSVSWNTATTANGSHTLTARARDGVGNLTTSAPVSVTTSNANPDPIPPTVSITSPADQATVSGQVTVTADASDNVGVAGVQFLLDGVSLGPEDTTAPYSVTWDSSTANNGFHTLTARARDAVGFQTTSSPINVTVTGGTSAGLMAAYGFSENAGTASADLSGNSNNASLVNGAAWVAGKYGTGVNFDGVDDHVSVPHAPTLTLGNTGTVEAWVKLNAISRWNGIVAKGAANDARVHNYAIEVTNTNRFSCLIGSGTAFRNVISTTLASAGQFYHLACTWDGTTIRLYLNGVLEASLAQNLTPAANTAPVTIGRFGGGADHLAGVIDDVRIYNRALNVSEIQSDMNTPAGGSAPPSDTTPPSVSVTSPTNGATVSGTVSLTADASDNVGVTGVQFFVNGTAIPPEDTTAPYSVTWDSTTVANGGPYNITARARDAATNQTTSAVVPVSVNNAAADTTPPSVTLTAPANGDSVTGTVALTATASDNVGVAGVQFFVDGNPLGAEDTVAPYSANWDTSTATTGAHTITASARDAATNQATSSPVTVSVGVFQDSVALSGFTNPTVVQFSADGRVFVAEKSGLIKVFDNLNDTTPTVFADLSTNVHNFWDRGLLGMALHPDFPNTPQLYVLYTHDAAIGGTAPRWGTAGVLSDPCPNPPGATADGCVVSGRLSKLVAEGNVMSGAEQVLIEDWCQQYPSHSIGSLAFGADGALYVSGGDGASFNFTDFGQDGNPVNPCGDPPGAPGTVLTAPTAEGGALRSQDLRTAGDPVTLDGTILRLDPNTGLALSSNPLFGNSDVNARRIVAYGLRNPFRLTVRPGTSEVWAGDVGWNIWEEINRIPDPTAGVLNFGWPCYEALDRQSGYDGANLNICENLYTAGGAVTAPYFSYRHDQTVVTGEPCGTGSSSISGLAFYTGGPYPSQYDGALFFADYSRDCIWVMFKGANGLPQPTNIATFRPGAPNPVDLKIGPQGDLFYLDFDAGTLRRVRFFTGNTPPTAVASANPTSGTSPLTVQFNGSASSDPDAGNTLTYDWDLTGDGVFGDSNLPQPSFTYTLAGSYSVRLRVTDNHGAFDTSAPIVINVNNTAPVATIATPSSSTTWKVGDTINFSGSATDAEQGNLPPSALTWSIILHHCPSNCHTHPVQDIVGVASGSFTAPDHEYPSHIELRLTARDSGGLQDIKSVMLNPATVNLSFASEPSGLQITVGSQTSAAPFARTVIVNSSNSVSAVSPQVLSGTNYTFSSWSDGGAQTHNITAPQAPASFTATYTNAPAIPPGLRAAYGFSEGSGTTTADLSGNSNNGTLTNGPTWTAGKYGNGINFDGINDSVSVPHNTSLTLGNTGTIEAWVKLNTAGRWNAILSKGSDKNNRNHNYGMEVSNQNRFLCVLGNGTTSRALFSTTVATAGQFYHVACTWDATTLRLYVNGILDASLAQNIVPAANTAPVRIGQFGGGVDSLAGVVDEVRIYDRALTASEIQSDMNLPINGTPPPPDSIPPTVSLTAPAEGATVSGITTLTADASDNVGVAGVQFFVNGNPIGSEDTTAPYSESWNTSSVSNGGPYTITARARDLNNQTTSAPVSVTVNNTAPPPPVGGLVAAYGFDEGSGTVVSDSSGSGNHGTINGATWTGAGRFAQALSFNGSTHWVTVPDAASLDLTNGVTLGAWVKPAVATGWRTIVLKEQTAGITYAMYANTSKNRPSAHVFITSEQDVQGPAALPVDTWSHVAMTFNGSVLRLYVNGIEVSARALAGNMVVSTGVLRIGGNSIWGEYFNGLIDEVKIYNRALTADEIQGDMNAPVNAPPPTDTTPPTVTVIAPAASATVGGQTALYAEASDSSGIAGVQFYVDGSLFGSEITTAPFTVAWNTAGATNGSHSITAVARDFANNLATSAPVNVTVANTNDPALIGAWSAPFSWPIVAVNLVVTRTGELISWDGPPSNGGSSAQLWNPATGVFTPIPNNLTNMFCDGAVVLQDGRVLAMGGHAASGVGIPNADIFDPITKQWTQAAPMTHGRWYPTATLLPDGRVLAMSGSDTCYNCMVRVPEIYDPVTNQWTALPAIPASAPAFYYPQLFVLPDGRVLEAGGTETSGPTTTRVMDVGTGTWTTVDSVSREGHSAVMYEPGKVMKSGATPDVGVSSAPAVSTTFVLDMAQPSPRWQQVPNMAHLRAFHVQTILPDGSVLATGGDSTRLGTDYATSVLAAELWSPVTKTWSTMAAQQNGRLYHSTAALLLDGRVLVAGSGRVGAPPQFNAEIYSPPYLFKGPRPAISSTPTDVTYGSTFSVETPDAAGISSVTMLRLSAVTHSLNMDQRFLRLNFSQGAGGVNVQAPANANLAPPGYYALYILNSAGVPSPGAVIRIH